MKSSVIVVTFSRNMCRVSHVAARLGEQYEIFQGIKLTQVQLRDLMLLPNPKNLNGVQLLNIFCCRLKIWNYCLLIMLYCLFK